MSRVGEYRLRLRRLEREISDFRKALHDYIGDQRLLDDGVRLYFALDFSEFYKYLYPRKEREAASASSARFHREQIAIRYLLEQAESISIILLRPYFRELRNSLRSIHLQVLGGLVEENAALTSDMEHLSNVMNSIKRAVQSGRLKSELLIAGNGIEVDVTSEEYQEYYNFLSRRRQGNPASNANDAEAIIIIRQLNSLLLEKKEICLFVTTSRYVSELVQQVCPIDPNDKSSPSIHRNLHYALVHFYFEELRREERISRHRKIERNLASAFSGIESIQRVVRSIVGEEVPASINRQLERTLEDAVHALEFFDDLGDSTVDALLEEPKELRRRIDEALGHLALIAEQFAEIATVLHVPPMAKELGRVRERLRYRFVAEDPSMQEEAESLIGAINEEPPERLLAVRLRIAELILERPNHVDVLTIFARLSLRLQDFQGASDTIEKAKNLRGDHVEALFAEAILLRKRDRDYRRSITILERLRSIESGDPRFLRELGFLHWCLYESPEIRGDEADVELEEAIRFAKAGLDLCMDDESIQAWIMNDLAYYLALRNRNLEELNEAAELIENAVTLAGGEDCRRSELFDTKGFVALQRFRIDKRVDDLELAVRSFATALDRDPGNDAARAHLMEGMREFRGFIKA